MKTALLVLGVLVATAAALVAAAASNGAQENGDALRTRPNLD